MFPAPIAASVCPLPNTCAHAMAHQCCHLQGECPCVREQLQCAHSWDAFAHSWDAFALTSSSPAAQARDRGKACAAGVERQGR